MLLRARRSCSPRLMITFRTLPARLLLSIGLVYPACNSFCFANHIVDHHCGHRAESVLCLEGFIPFIL